jgi:hypothetical protein
MLYEDAFLDKVEFGTTTYNDFQGGGSEVKECVAGYPALKHLSIPLGLVVRPFPSATIINADAIIDVMESDKYDALYEKTLDTHKGRKTRREIRPVTNKRVTKRLFF